jgi:hypothetical protein
MPEQYVATDKRTGLEVSVTGDFPPHHDDRIRIARTCTLFTRLMATILGNPSESERREQFVAIETQLELAEALIRGDMKEVQTLLQSTLERMGLGPEELDEAARRILQEFGDGKSPNVLDELGLNIEEEDVSSELPQPDESFPDTETEEDTEEDDSGELTSA